MKILGIETATSAGGAALVEDERVIAERHSSNARTHSERLLPSIDELLAETGWDAGDLDLIAVSAGPGSFTGLRIGISTAKGLAMAAHLPLVATPTLDAFARLVADGNHPVRPVIDARKGEVFTAPFDSYANRLGPDVNITPGELVDRLKNSGPVLIAGDGARRYRKVLDDALGDNAIYAPPEKDDPRAWAVATLGGKLFKKGASSDPAAVVPIYVRLSDAEIHAGNP